MNDTDRLMICRRQIEAKLAWGDSRQWTTNDFARLSELILDATGIALSVNTLKRIFGRIAYQHSPNPTTLDALARFLGHASWRAFGATLLPEPPPALPQVAHPEQTPVGPTANAKSSSYNSGLMWSAGLLMGIGIAFVLAFSLRSPPPRPAPVYSFSSRVVAQGVPNSVVFTYDVSQASSDCVAIQQSWDPQRRFTVDPRKHQISSQYYYPGFFRAGLVVDGQIVKQHPLLIRTQGWLPLIERKPVPVYFKAEEVIHGGQLGLSRAQIESMHVPMQPTPPWVNYFWVDDWSRVSSNNFTLETEFKNDYAEGSGACQQTQLVILCQDNAIMLPFSRPGCVSDLTLHVVDQHLEGLRNDLSGFGCDFSKWVRVRCEVRNKRVRVFLNNTMAYQLVFQNEAGPLVGLCFRFQGTGSVNSVRLTEATGKIVFEDNFDQHKG